MLFINLQFEQHLVDTAYLCSLGHSGEVQKLRDRMVCRLPVHVNARLACWVPGAWVLGISLHFYQACPYGFLAGARHFLCWLRAPSRCVPTEQARLACTAFVTQPQK